MERSVLEGLFVLAWENGSEYFPSEALDAEFHGVERESSGPRVLLFLNLGQN